MKNSDFTPRAHSLRPAAEFKQRLRSKRHARPLALALLLLLCGALWPVGVARGQGGGLDPAFGVGGKVMTDVATNNRGDIGEKVLLQPDGKIVVVGYAYSILCIFPCFRVPDPMLVRYNPDGSLDETFGNGGRVVTVLSARAFLYDAALQPDGKIVAVGTYDPSIHNNAHDYLVMRYNPNGTLDTSFDGDGIATLTFGTNYEDAKNVGLQSDGKIVVTGVSKTNNGTPYTVMVRFNTDGSHDTGFGAGGLVILGIQAHNALAIEADDKILLGGGGGSSFSTTNSQVVRYHANGTIDTGFGSPVTAVSEVDFAPGAFDDARALAVQPDGKVLLSSSGADFSVARLDPNGTLDTSFGANGRSSTAFPGPFAVPYALAVQADGRIVLAGEANSDFALVRLNPDGSFAGKVMTDFNGRRDKASSVAIQADGKVVAAGDSLAPDGVNSLLSEVAVARYVDISQQSRVQPFDLDGDGKGDIAVYRPGANATASSYWHIFRSGTNTYQQTQYGLGEDIIVPADYDGDGITNIAVFRPSTGIWYTTLDAASGYGAVRWGQSGDIPVPGDYNNDGRADVAVYRPGNGTWYIYTMGTGSVTVRQFGGSLDKPVAGDYDNDGKTDLAYISESAGNLDWNILRSSDNTTVTTRFGVSGDRAVVADYDGNGSSDIAVFRPSTGRWYTSLDPATNYGEMLWGQNGDVPAPADYDGDGKTDHAVFRPANSTFYIRQSTNGALAGRQWGVSTDTPVPAAYVR